MIRDTKTTLKNAIKILCDDYMINSYYVDPARNLKELETIADLTILYFKAEEETKNNV